MRLRRRHRRLLFRTGLLSAGILCIAAGLLIVLLKTNTAAVRGITVSGAEALNPQEIETVVRETISEPLLRFLPLRGNLLFLPRDRAVERILGFFPRVKEASVKRHLKTRFVTVRILERKPEGVYCRGQREAEPTPEEGVSAPSISTEQCFLIDRDGVIFDGAPETEGSLILSIVDAFPTEIPPDLGATVLDEETFSAVLTVWDVFRQEIRVGVRRVVRSEDGTLAVETLEGWRALFDPRGDLRAQAVGLRELLEKELEKERRIGIAEIDLRVPGRIYYR